MTEKRTMKLQHIHAACGTQESINILHDECRTLVALQVFKRRMPGIGPRAANLPLAHFPKTGKGPFEPDAIVSILERTHCYPYFLQEWGKHSWDAASRSPINESDAHFATEQALAELDASFFRVRFDRLTPSEKRYMRAMAELGPGPTDQVTSPSCLAKRSSQSPQPETV
jgi:hypothetical protein